MKTPEKVTTDSEVLEAVMSGLDLKFNPEYKHNWAKAILREINNKIEVAKESTKNFRLWQFDDETYVFSSEVFEVYSFGNEDGHHSFDFRLGKEPFSIVNPTYTVITGNPFNFYVNGFMWHKNKWNMVRLRFAAENYAEKLRADGNYTIKMRSWEKML
jgi:hypothetical protein